MSDPVQLLALAGLLGTGAIGGVFFAFSSFVMPALARVPDEQGITAMQDINVTVICFSMMGTFLGTALLSLGALVVGFLRLGEPDGPLLVAAGALYFVGTFLLTGTRNVPLNNALAAVDAASPEAVTVWHHYLRVWTRWNTARTVAAFLSTAAFALALT